MSRAVWRFELPDVENELVMPIGARVVHVGWSRNRMQLWAEVNTSPARVKERRTFHVRGTGLDVPDGSTHVGSIIAGDGYHVFHIYENRPQ